MALRDFLALYLIIKPAGRVPGARAFDELRRYHARPLRLNWGPKNVHFVKTHFRKPDIDASFFFIFLVFFI